MEKKWKVPGGVGGGRGGLAKVALGAAADKTKQKKQKKIYRSNMYDTGNIYLYNIFL